MKIKPNDSRGSLLISLLITLPFLILIAASYMSLSTHSFRLGKADQFHTSAQLAADAGADYAVEQLNLDPSWTGTTSPVEIHNDGKIKTTFTASISDVDSTHKTITATGYTYSPVSHSTPDASISIKVDLRAVTTGDYSLVTGVGGLFLSNSAKIVGGSVYVNGEIDMSNSAQIGLSTNYVNVSVANQICPLVADATYPRLCNSGENNNPITLNNTAHIYGDVQANYQTSTSGMSNNGLIVSTGVATKPLPTYDRDAQKAAVATTITGAAASCNGSQTRTWAANTKITGNVTVTNNCVVTVQGNVWITGTLSVRNSGIVQVSDSLGATQPVIMIDGATGASFANSSQLKSNASSTGFQIMTYYSRASCSPDCSTVTGTDLYNSRNDATITLDNSAQGPNTIFYAFWTQVLVNNSGQIGALVGQTVSLKNSGTITFGTSVSGTGETTWIINGYRRSY